MNELEIARILRSHPHTKPYFKGVYACDELPEKFSNHSLYIINLSPRHTLGSHWVTIYVNKVFIGQYFDSAGRPPYVPSIVRPLSALKFYIYNSIQIQSEKSLSCGLYAILFGLFFCRGFAIYEIRLFFLTDHHLLQLNEHLVAALMSKELIRFGAPWSIQLAREIRKYRTPLALKQTQQDDTNSSSG